MESKTISEEHLIYRQSKSKEISEGVVDASQLQSIIDMLRQWKWTDDQEGLPEIEMSDSEIQGLPERTGIFTFLYDNAEDIYNKSDGEPLE